MGSSLKRAGQRLRKSLPRQTSQKEESSRRLASLQKSISLHEEEEEHGQEHGEDGEDGEENDGNAEAGAHEDQGAKGGSVTAGSQVGDAEPSTDTTRVERRKAKDGVASDMTLKMMRGCDDAVVAATPEEIAKEDADIDDARRLTLTDESGAARPAGRAPLCVDTGEPFVDPWYVCNIINDDPDTILIHEPRSSLKNNNYLVIGKFRAVLIDTGPGSRDIGPVVAR